MKILNVRRLILEGLRKNYIVVAALLIFLFMGIVYIQKNFVNAPFEDGLWMLPILGKYFNGTLSLHDMTRPFGEHRLIGYHLIFLLNALLFHLNMKVEPLLCLLSYFFIGILLYFPYKRSLGASSPNESKDIWVQLSYVTILFSIFSLVHPPMILMSTQFTIGTAIFVAAAMFFDQICRGDARWKTGAKFLICMAVYLTVFSGAYFGGALFSLLGCLILKIAAFDDKKLDSLLVVSITLTLMMMLGYLLLTRTAGGGLGPKLRLFILQPRETVAALFAGLSATTIDIHTFMERFHGQKSIILINGGFLILLGVYALARFIALKIYRVSWLPVLLMMYTVGAILTIRLGRLEGGWGQPLAEWYSFHMSYYLIGVLWILYYDLFRVESWRNKRSIILPALSMIFIFSTQGYSDFAQWRRVPYNHAWYEAKKEALLFPNKDSLNVLDLASFSTEDELLKDIRILRKHKLSCFYRNSPDRFSVTIGNDLKSARLLSGWYDWDGHSIWMGKQSESDFLTGPQGKCSISAYIPKKFLPNAVTVVTDGTLNVRSKLREGSNEIDLDKLSPNAIVKLKIMVDKAFAPNRMGWGPDKRELGLLVSSIKCS